MVAYGKRSAVMAQDDNADGYYDEDMGADDELDLSFLDDNETKEEE